MTEKKSFVVLDLLCGDGRIANAVKARKKGTPVKYIGVDGKHWPYENYTWKEKPGVNFHKMDLDFKNEVKLKEQLEEVLHGEQVDEIHLHMPDYPNQIKSPHVLQLLHTALKPGGRLYHMVDSNSQSIFGELRDLHPPNGDRPNVVFRENKSKLEAKANETGFKLEKYGVKTYLYNSGGEYWYTGPKRNATAKRKNAKIVEKYTAFPLVTWSDKPYLMHFIIAKKV